MQFENHKELQRNYKTLKILDVTGLDRFIYIPQEGFPHLDRAI